MSDDDDDDKIIPFNPKRMMEEDYDRERQRIKDTYGDSKSEAGGRWEEELAKLFWLSGWTQEELAAKEGKSQTWINFRLRFGRFITFTENITTGNNKTILTERRFREYWGRVDGTNERQRFRQIHKLIEADLADPPKRNTGASKAIRERFADGKWHSIERIAAALTEFPQETITQLLLRDRGGVTGVKREIRPRGRSKEVRLFPTDKTVGTVELTEKLVPLITELKAEGRKNMATIAISRIAKIAAELQEMLDEWTR